MSDLTPVRNIAKYGIICDCDPYTLPVGAWSFGVNARFRNGKVTRGPVYRNVRSLSVASPRFLYGFSPTAGVESAYIGYLSGQVYLTTPAAQTDYSISGYVPSSTEAVWTACHVGGLPYINREDRVPWYLPSGATQFVAIPGWNANDRAHIIRSSNSAIIAFNVTESAVNYPTMIRTSSFAIAGTPPASWDYTTPSTNSTRNILADMESSIVDAQTLHNDVYIYGSNETWLMQFVAGTQIWAYRKVFDNRGAINANCSIEVNGMHYVFGEDDIWSHDGTVPKSISDGRVREFIYATLDRSRAFRFFVTHNPALKEIHFCYVSGDQKTAFPGYNQSGFDGCNRQAVYNYAFDTWTFDDIPYCYYAARANIDVSLTYATITTTYATQGGTYQDQSNSTKKPLCYVGDNNTTYSLTRSMYAFDQYGPGSIAPFAVDTNATAGFYLEHGGIDLTSIGKDLPDFILLSSVYPQGRLDTGAVPVSFVVGGADYYTSLPVLSAPQTWNGSDLYKLDFNMAGRYLTMQITLADYKSITLTGFDLDLGTEAER
jgi:hypothetical protein